MASVKLGTLLIRTIAKPISNTLKQQAKDHESFRRVCVSLAQGMYRTEAKLRTTLLGEPVKPHRPLSETRAIENGANALAEGFLFAVAASLIVAETWRSSRSTSKRREDVDEQLETLAGSIQDLVTRVDGLAGRLDEGWEYERQKNEELARVLTRIVDVGLRGGWAQFEENPIQLPRMSLPRPVHSLAKDNADETSDVDHGTLASASSSSEGTAA